MINGTMFAPFRHDSTWPSEIIKDFREAVYNFYACEPGNSSESALRGLARLELEEVKKEERNREDSKWFYVKTCCDKFLHCHGPDRSKGIDAQIGREARTTLLKNLLILANILLIGKYGLARQHSIHMKTGDEVADNNCKERRVRAVEEYLAHIEAACRDLEESYRLIEEPKRENEMKLKGKKVLSEIPIVVPVMERAGGDCQLEVVLHRREEDVCVYEFRDVDPVGWEMVGGNLGKDQFAHDETSTHGRDMKDLSYENIV